MTEQTISPALENILLAYTNWLIKKGYYTPVGAEAQETPADPHSLTVPKQDDRPLPDIDTTASELIP